MVGYAGASADGLGAVDPAVLAEQVDGPGRASPVSTPAALVAVGVGRRHRGAHRRPWHGPIVLTFSSTHGVDAGTSWPCP